MLSVISPAPFFEACGLWRDAARHKPQYRGAISLQLARGDTVGFLDDGRLIALMGFYPTGPGTEEVFLAGVEAAIVGPHMLMLARCARLILRARLDDGIREMTGFVRHGHRPGQRLARLAGFALVDKPGWAGCERWELIGHEHGELPLRGQQRSGGGGRPGAAALPDLATAGAADRQ